MFQDIITNFWYWQILGVQYFKKKEIYNSRAILNIHASALIKLFELLNNPEILLLETNKRIEKFLTKKQLRLIQKITTGYNPKEIKQALERVMTIFPGVVEEIKEKYNYPYYEKLEKKLKPRLLALLKE